MIEHEEQSKACGSVGFMILRFFMLEVLLRKCSKTLEKAGSDAQPVLWRSTTDVVRLKNMIEQKGIGSAFAGLN